MTRRWSIKPNPDEILVEANLIAHQDDHDDHVPENDGLEWNLVVHDEDDDGILEFVFWEE